MTDRDGPWVDLPPIDTEQMRGRHRAATSALGTLRVRTNASMTAPVEATLSDTLMLVAAIERVRLTHAQVEWLGKPACVECVMGDGGPAPYPCATIKAINP